MPDPIPEAALQAAAEAMRARYVEEFREPIKPVAEFLPDVRYIVEAAAPAFAVREEEIRADERRKVAEEFTAYEDLLGSIWLYIGWRFVTGQLTTEQKNLFADAVDACWRRSDLAEGEDFMAVDRWWRDDAPIRQIGEARDSR